jgi:hypothetical protein
MNCTVSRILAKWAALHALMFLAWMTAERLLGFHDSRLQQQPVVGMLILLPSIALYALALLDLKRHYYAGRLSWRQGFLAGCQFTLFIVLLSPLTQWLTAAVISPDYFTNLTEFAVSSGNLTREQALQQFNLQYYVVSSVVAGLMMGVFFSAVIALFTRTRGVAA